jgi:hypothetical protein
MNGTRGNPIKDFILGAYAPLLALIFLLPLAAWLHRHQIHPDAVSYLRLAKYYWNGQIDLAVTGYWGPMLSWLIAPLLPMFDNPLYAGRTAMAISAVVYFLGCTSVFRAFRIDPAGRVLGAWIVVFFAVTWSIIAITPDLLMSGLMCFPISLMISHRWVKSRRVQFGAGALYGVAYLAKAVAFLASFGLILVFAALWTVSRQMSLKASLRGAALTVLGLLLVAGPWIAVISLKYDRLLFTTSGRINYAIHGPRDVERGHPTWRTFHTPELGRITSWEDPSNMPYAYWSPFDNSLYALHQINLFISGLKTFPQRLSYFDWFGVGFVSVLFGFLLHVPWRENLRTDRWRWAIVPIACFGFIFIPLELKSPRFYFVLYPFLIVASFGFVRSLINLPRRESNVLRWVGTILVAVSFLAPLKGTFRWAVTTQPYAYYPSTQEMRLRRIPLALADRLREARLVGTLASATPNYPMVSLAIALFLNMPWHGNVSSAQTADEILRSNARLILVERGSPVDTNLRSHSEFEDLDSALFESSKQAQEFPIKVYLNKSVGPDTAGQLLIEKR